MNTKEEKEFDIEFERFDLESGEWFRNLKKFISQNYIPKSKVEEVGKRLNQKGNGKMIIDGREVNAKLHTNIQVGYNQALLDLKKALLN